MTSRASKDDDFEVPTHDEVMAMLEDLLGENEEELWKQAEIELRYMGFNVIDFRKSIYKVKRNPTVTIKDVTELLRLFLIRGTKISKIKQKSDSKHWKKYGDLLKDYNVKETVPASDIGQTVTLGRISNAFPDLSARILLGYKTKRFPSIEVDMPDSFRFAGAAALIPNDATYLKNAHYTFCIKMDELLNTGKLSRTPADAITNYWYASHQSELMADNTRVMFLQAMDLHGDWVTAKHEKPMGEETETVLSVTKGVIPSTSSVTLTAPSSPSKTRVTLKRAGTSVFSVPPKKGK